MHFSVKLLQLPNHRALSAVLLGSKVSWSLLLVNSVKMFAIQPKILNLGFSIPVFTLKEVIIVLISTYSVCYEKSFKIVFIFLHSGSAGFLLHKCIWIFIENAFNITLLALTKKVILKTFFYWFATQSCSPTGSPTLSNSITCLLYLSP